MLSFEDIESFRNQNPVGRASPVIASRNTTISSSLFYPGVEDTEPSNNDGSTDIPAPLPTELPSDVGVTPIALSESVDDEDSNDDGTDESDESDHDESDDGSSTSLSPDISE